MNPWQLSQAEARAGGRAEVAGGDALAQTRALADTLASDKDGRFAQSKFLQFISKMSRGEIILEGNEVRPCASLHPCKFRITGRWVRQAVLACARVSVGFPGYLPQWRALHVGRCPCRQRTSGMPWWPRGAAGTVGMLVFLATRGGCLMFGEALLLTSCGARQ